MASFPLHSNLRRNSIFGCLAPNAEALEIQSIKSHVAFKGIKELFDAEQQKKFIMDLPAKFYRAMIITCVEYIKQYGNSFLEKDYSGNELLNLGGSPFFILELIDAINPDLPESPKAADSYKVAIQKNPKKGKGSKKDSPKKELLNLTANA
jgi:hypothetical protein